MAWRVQLACDLLRLADHFQLEERRQRCECFLSQQSVIGVLNVYTREPHRFSNDERNIFQTLARMGAIAIQNARLYRRVFDTESTLRQSEKMNTLGLLAAEGRVARLGTILKQGWFAPMMCHVVMLPSAALNHAASRWAAR